MIHTFRARAEVISAPYHIIRDMVRDIWENTGERSEVSSLRNNLLFYELRRSRNSITVLIIGESVDITSLLEKYTRQFREIRRLRNYAEIFPNYPEMN